MVISTSIINFPITFYQFAIQDLIFQWQLAGIFEYVLPFLLIFALVFGILTGTNILGDHRGVNLVIALVIGLMSLQLWFVRAFFTELFPRFAIGLAIMLVVVVLSGMFIQGSAMKGWLIGFSIAGAVIGIVVILITFNQFRWFDSFFWQNNWGLIIGGVLMIIIIIAVFVTAGEKPERKEIVLPIPKFR